MTLSPMVINGLLIGGMIVVLLFILGVLNALSTSRKPVASVPAWAEIDDLDLDGRLNNLGAKKSIAGFGDASPAVSGFGTLSSPAPSRAATAERSPSRSAKSTRPNESTTAPSARFALPTSGRVQPPMATPAPTISGQGLNPLSARFSSMDLAPAPAPEELSPGKPSVQKPAATGANGILSSVLGRQDHIPAPAPRTEFLSSPADTAAQEQALPADDRSTPPEAARRFTEAPGAKPQSASRAPRPPVNPIVTRALPTTPQAPTRRLGLPGTVARGAEQGASQRAASFDIQALLRGEGGTAAPVPAVPSTAPLKQAPAAPIFSAVPLTPTPGDGAPLGAMPFDPNLLHAREPVETPASRVEAASNGVATKFDSAAAPGSASNGSTDFFGPARYEDRAPERMPATARPVDLDATHLVDGFDLPDSEFETHVFSTAELIDDHAVGSFSYPSVVADVQDTPSIAFSTSPVSAPVPEEPVALS
ncbi:MAG TPA: hypothetical protein VHB98_20875, partial [Chloroflexota bacterium]|nr:hypothetical protein [Chloroflexota bacterium]